MTIGEKIYILRKQKGLSQEQLSRHVAVSRQTVSKWEMDSVTPDTDSVVRLSEFFGVSTDFLLKGEFSNPSEYAQMKAEADITNKFKLSRKAVQLLDEKGYIGAYIVALQCLPAILILFFICFAYLSALSSAAPLNELPGQAFILPAIAGAAIIAVLIRAIIFLVLGYKLSKVQRKEIS